MKSNKLLCRILAKREILLQVAQDFDILRIGGLKSEQICVIIIMYKFLEGIIVYFPFVKEWLELSWLNSMCIQL